MNRTDITVEYQNGKKVVYLSRDAKPGTSTLNDYQMLRKVADEVGADVRDPYNKLIPALATDKIKKLLN